MKRIIVACLLLLLPSLLSAYTFTNYRNFEPHEFSLEYKYITDSIATDNSKQRVALTPIGVSFTFHSLEYELTLFPISLKKDDGTTATGTNVSHTFANEDFNIWLKN